MTAIRCCFVLFALCFTANSNAYADDDSTVRFGKGIRDKNGFLVHSVQSPYQAGTTKVRVLLPDRFDKDKKYPILFVLPVEAKDGNSYGDGLLEVKKDNLHNKHDLICVAMTFSHLPWYADHPTDKTIRQETYLLKVIVPFVEKSYPAVGKPEGRLLVGFSKSGWGAFTLLLRHPKVFCKAAAFDAPLMRVKPHRYGMSSIFGTQENFEKYQVTTLLKQRAELLAKSNRLVLTGYGAFQEEHRQVHRLMNELGIKCEYRDGPRRPHHWNGGWLQEAVGLMMKKKIVD